MVAGLVQKVLKTTGENKDRHFRRTPVEDRRTVLVQEVHSTPETPKCIETEEMWV